MRRLLVAVLVLAACGAAVATASRGGSDAPTGPRYTVELDNAFGLTEGADVKVAGVRAGRVTGMRVDRRSQRALVDFSIEQAGFGSLRSDVFCETRPQSLIGEYFIDCRPGKAPQKLEQGATIPVEQTASTIPIDLINNVMRRPYRERLRIILDELGAGVGGRSDQIQETLRRAVPALRETDRVLAILADQNQVLKNLTSDADTVIGDLSDNRKNVGRFVKEAEDVATISATRRREIEAALQRLPTFLRELRPTMAELGATADASTPYLRDLNASAGQLERFLENLGPFAEATRGNVRTLADAADYGRPAIRTAKPTVRELKTMTRKAPELSKNLKIVLRDLDSRKRAVEKDKRSPGGQGYTGFEAFLQYVFDQMMAINIYDENGHILKVNLSASECSEYQNADSVKRKEKESPGFISRCLAGLGPNQPGVTTGDPSDTGVDDAGHNSPLTALAAKRKGEDKGKQDSRKQSSNAPGQPDLKRELDKLLKGGNKLPNVKAPSVPLPSAPKPTAPNVSAGNSGGQAVDPQNLLDYLLAP